MSGPELEEAPSTFYDDRLSSAFDIYEQIHVCMTPFRKFSGHLSEMASYRTFIRYSVRRRLPGEKQHRAAVNS